MIDRSVVHGSADDSDDRFDDDSDDRFDGSVFPFDDNHSSVGRRICMLLGKVTCCGEITPQRDVKTLYLGVKLHQCNTDNLSIWIKE